MLFVRPRESSEASDGRLMSFTGGGLRDRCRLPVARSTEESSDADVKCFELTSGTGGASARVGDCDERPYLEVFRRILGGERLPVGVETGDIRWNSASSARERTLLNAGRVDGVSFGGDDSRVLVGNSCTSGAFVGERSHIIIVPLDSLEVSFARGKESEIEESHKFSP